MSAYDDAITLWCRYHTATENFDRTLPHRRLPDADWAEVRWDFREYSVTFAQFARKIVGFSLERLELSEHEQARAKAEAGAMSCERQAQIAGQKLRPFSDTVW